METICIRAHLTGPLGTLLMEEFAEPIELITDTDEMALSAPIALIQQDISHPRCGQPALLKSAGDILFIRLLRHLVAHPKPKRPGLLHALSDVRFQKLLWPCIKYHISIGALPHWPLNLACRAPRLPLHSKKRWTRPPVNIWLH